MLLFRAYQPMKVFNFESLTNDLFIEIILSEQVLRFVAICG